MKEIDYRGSEFYMWIWQENNFFCKAPTKHISECTDEINKKNLDFMIMN